MFPQTSCSFSALPRIFQSEAQQSTTTSLSIFQKPPRTHSGALMELSWRGTSPPGREAGEATAKNLRFRTANHYLFELESKLMWTGDQQEAVFYKQRCWWSKTLVSQKHNFRLFKSHLSNQEAETTESRKFW